MTRETKIKELIRLLKEINECEDSKRELQLILFNVLGYNVIYSDNRDKNLIEDYKDLVSQGIKKKEIRMLLAEKYFISVKTVEGIIYNKNILLS